MSDLSQEDRSLIEIGGQEDLPDPSARDRMRRRLAARIGVTAGLGTVAVATKTAAASSAAVGAGSSLAIKIATTVAIVTALGGGGTWLVRAGAKATPAPPSAGSVERVPRSAPSSPITPTIAEPLPTAAATVPTADSPPPAAAAAGEAPPVAAKPIVAKPIVADHATASPGRADARVLGPALAPAKTNSEGATTHAARPGPSTLGPADPASPTADRKPSLPADELAEETRLLRDADALTRGGQPVRALALLDEHARRFPRGILGEERDVERILSLCAAGRRQEARVSAERFLASRPRSPLAGRVRGSCGGS